MKSWQVIILAADGFRPLAAVGGRPSLLALLESVRAAGIDPEPVIMVGERSEEVIHAVGPSYSYLYQEDRTGTGQAVLAAREAMVDRSREVLVLYADQPLLSAATLERVAKTHELAEAAATLVTTAVENFRDWRRGFYDFGRVERDESGQIVKIVETAEALFIERQNREVVAGCFAFQASWLWPNLYRLSDHNTKRQYYLTDLVKIAVAERKRLTIVPIAAREALSFNTPEQLEALEKFVQAGKLTESLDVGAQLS